MLGGEQQAWLSLLLGIAIVWWLRRGPAALRGTTLVAAWCWAVLAVVAVAAVEVALGFQHAHTSPLAQPIRFAVAVLTLCPAMALLGAKRPQNGPWQFVVLTLAAILVLPAAEVWVRGRGETLQLHTLWSWFLVILILVGLANHLPTRFGFAAVCVAAAQAVLLWRYLPFTGLLNAHPPPVIGLMLLLLAVTIAGRTGVAHRTVPETSGQHVGDAAELAGWSAVWRAFRDWFGTVWSVRVMERMNASAAMYGWPVLLGWDGFVPKSDAAVGHAANSGHAQLPPGRSSGTAGEQPSSLAPEQLAAIEQSLRTLLRRFVSAEWIDRRLRGHHARARAAG
jgi:hypothetical protein